MTPTRLLAFLLLCCPAGCLSPGADYCARDVPCPEGGAYHVGPLDEMPVCSVHGSNAAEFSRLCERFLTEQQQVIVPSLMLSGIPMPHAQWAEQWGRIRFPS